jgi:plastocyanin
MTMSAINLVFLRRYAVSIPLAALAVLLLQACGTDTSGGSNCGGTSSGYGYIMCSSNTASCTSSNATATGAVEIKGMTFSPSCFSVVAGGSVTFTNGDTVAHTVTTDTGQAEAFDSGSIAPGGTFTHTFGAPGTIMMHCSIHASMHATAVVE